MPPVQLDNFVDILCNESYKEIGLSTKRILADKNTGRIEIGLGESGVRDIINLGLKARLLTRKTGRAFLNEDGIKLCNILKEKEKEKELWSYLHRCLQRIDVYREYVNYLREPQKEKAAKEFMGKKTTAKCMFRWLQRMGMLNEYKVDESVQYIPLEDREKVTEEEFLNALKETYEEKAKAAGPMWKGTFIAIQQLREGVCRRIETRYDEFDDLLRQLLSADKLGSIKVRLAKGPATAYERAGKLVFEFEGERFLYIALNEVQNE